MIDYPDTAQLVLPMQHYSSATEYDMSLGDDHDATLTNMATRNMTIVPGAGRWVRSRPFGTGFECDGAATDMTNDGYQPLHNIGQFSIEVLCIPGNVTDSFTRLVSQYGASGNHAVEVMQNGDDIFCKVSDGASNVQFSVANVLVVGELIHIVFTWDKDVNDGKPVMYIDNSKTTAVSGITNVTSCADDMTFAEASFGGDHWEGVICKILID